MITRIELLFTGVFALISLAEIADIARLISSLVAIVCGLVYLTTNKKSLQVKLKGFLQFWKW